MYTVIPDLHADPARLARSLSLAGSDSQLAFLGDFIDSHDNDGDDSKVLESVRTLIDAGRAVGVMGNHELNAILYHRHDLQGRPLRKHSVDNQNQHKSFVKKFGYATPAALDWTDWFLNALPLWRDLGGLRLVHACWAEPEIEIIRARRPEGYLQSSDLFEIADESTNFGRAVKLLVSGPEARMPMPHAFTDLKGKIRHEVRLAWWRADVLTWREAALSVPEASLHQLPDGPLPPDVLAAIYDAQNPPVLVGHYKMKNEPRIEHPKAACLDYPDTGCIYRWHNEDTLLTKNLAALGN